MLVGLLATSPAVAQERSLADTEATRSYRLGEAYAAEARELGVPSPRPGGLRKQRWWVEHRLRPWIARRRLRNARVGRQLFTLYQGRGIHGALAQALVAATALDFAAALIRARSRARRPEVRALVSGVLDPVLRETVRGALPIFARCAATAEDLREFTIRDRCLGGARQLEAWAAEAREAGGSGRWPAGGR